ncbi:MaoC family dehydratase [soil metagenome]|jgi:acyl dehydratase
MVCWVMKADFLARQALTAPWSPFSLVTHSNFPNKTLPFYLFLMSKLTIKTFEEFEKYEGVELGVSEYHAITQEQINKFADATLDHQWIHLDPERAKAESPFGTTIAHGYLTVSLLPYLWGQIVSIENVKLQVNYGIESLRFNQAVLVDHQVRLRAKLLSLKNLRGITKAQIEVTMEIKDSKKPAFNGTITFLYHFNEEAGS